VRSFQTVTDGLAELRAAYLQNLDIDEDDEIDDELKAKLESTNVTALMKMARARPTKVYRGSFMTVAPPSGGRAPRDLRPRNR